MDRNGDGKVSREEFTGPKPRFDVLDRDRDGFLTQQELVAGDQASRRQGRGKKRAGAGKQAEDVKKDG